MIGNNPISATDMVYFVQIRRRKLRSFRYQGIRAIKQNQQNQKQTPNQGVLSRVLAIFGSLICRPGIVENTYVRIAKPSRISEEKDYQPRKPAISSSDEGVDETVKKILEVYSKVINREEPGSPPPVVQSKSLLNEDKGAEEVTEIQNGDQHTPIEEPKVEPENDPTPPPEVEVTSKQQDQPEVNKKGVESGTEAARENHQTVAAQNDNESQSNTKDEDKRSPLTEDGCHCKCLKIKVPTSSISTCNLSPASSSEDLFFSPIGTPEHEFDFDEFLMKKNSTNNKIDDIQSDKNNSNTNVQNGTVHNNHRGHKSSKKHSARMNGRIGTGSHH
ncbi:hypothetical protein ACFFRR_007419 [Megaselia abdita]